MAAPIPKIIPNQPRTPLTEPGSKPKKTQEILGGGFGTEPEVRLPKLQTETVRKWSGFHACHPSSTQWQPPRHAEERGYTVAMPLSRVVQRGTDNPKNRS